MKIYTVKIADYTEYQVEAKDVSDAVHEAMLLHKPRSFSWTEVRKVELINI